MLDGQHEHQGLDNLHVYEGATDAETYSMLERLRDKHVH